MATTNRPRLQQSEQQDIPKKRAPLRLLGIILLGIAILMFFYTTIAYVAWRNGQAARVKEAQAELNREIIIQLDLAQSELDRNQIKLVQHRLEWLQAQAPERAEVLSLQATVDVWQVPVAPTPIVATFDAVTEPMTPTPPPVISTATAAPTATPLPTTTALPDDASLRLPALKALLDDEQWEDAIHEITAFQLDQPAYERPTTDQMLFEAYIGAGIHLTNGEHVARGISYFEQAEKLGTLTEEGTSQLYYSKLYMTALSYMGVRWQVTVPALEELCGYVPNFHESCELLYEARIAYADQLVGDDPCAAQEQYQAALDYSPLQEVTSKQFNAQAACKKIPATPRPSGAWTPTPQPDS